MSKLKVSGNASGTGVITLEAPNTNTDRAITLPDSAGTLLMTDGDGSNLTGLSHTPEGTAVLSTGETGATKFLREDGDGTCSWQAAGGGLYASVAIIADQKAYDAEGGTFTAGAWRTRDLNTEISDADGIVSISSNQFTLATGTYTIEWEAPAAYTVNHHSTRLYNSTDASVEQLGSSEFTNSSISTISYGKDVVTISGSKTFEIQHFANLTSNTYGFGRKQHLDSSAVTILTLVKILKHS